MVFPKVVTFLLFSLLLSYSPAQAQTQEQLELIDALVGEFITINKITGFGLSVVQDGELKLAKGYGKANIAADIDVTDNTLFAVGSISKTFTSLLAVKVLSETFPLQGEAVLDTPIAELRSSLNFTLSDRFRSESVTFRDLLTHRTCVSNDDMIILFQAATHEELVYRKRYDEENCAFRTSFSYNNGLIALAGNILGKIAGKTYSELLGELFIDLGMKSSRVLDAEGSHEDLPNMSRAYTLIGEELVQFDPEHLRKASVVGGGGAVLSTAYDMGQFLKFFLNGGKVEGKVVVPEATLNWMYKASITFPAADYRVNTGPYAYGVGLILAFLEGQPWIKHNGFFQPYESKLNMFILPNNTKVGVFGSINGPGATELIGSDLSQDMVHVLIMKVLTGELTSMEDMHQARATLRSIPEMNSLSIDIESHPLYIQNIHKSLRPSKPEGVAHKRQVVEVVGVYGNRQNGVATVNENSDGTLQINYGEWGVGILTPRATNPNRYDVKWSTTIDYDFYSFRGAIPVPTISVDFGVPDRLEFILFEVFGFKLALTFNRDATLDTFPVIPWDPESCGPSSA